MRIVWKDSNARTGKGKPIKYRNYMISYRSGGWITDHPDDNNIYRTHYSAQNSLDERLGGYGKKGKPTEKRLSYGIEIIGQKEKG